MAHQRKGHSLIYMNAARIATKILNNVSKVYIVISDVR